MKWEAKDEPRSEMSEDKESVSERKQRTNENILKKNVRAMYGDEMV